MFELGFNNNNGTFIYSLIRQTEPATPGLQGG